MSLRIRIATAFVGDGWTWEIFDGGRLETFTDERYQTEWEAREAAMVVADLVQERLQKDGR